YTARVTRRAISTASALAKSTDRAYSMGVEPATRGAPARVSDRTAAAHADVTRSSGSRVRCRDHLLSTRGMAMNHATSARRIATMINEPDDPLFDALRTTVFWGMEEPVGPSFSGRGR